MFPSVCFLKIMRFVTNFAFFIALTVLITPSSLRAAPTPGPAGKIVILFDESASMNKQNSVSIAKLWVVTFLNTFTRPYQISLAGFSETTVIHAEAPTADPAQIAAMRKKVKQLQAHGLVTDFEKPFAYLARNKDSTTLAILITDGEPEIWDKKSWYLSRTIQHDDRYESLNADYRRMRGGGASKEKLYSKLAGSYAKRNLVLAGQWLCMIRDSPTIQLIVLDISGSNTYTRLWAEQSGGDLVVADMESRDPQAALRYAFSILQEKVSAALDEPLPPDATGRIETGSSPSQAPVPQPAPVVAQTSATPLEQNESRPVAVVAVIVAVLLALSGFSMRPKHATQPASAMEEAITPTVDFGLLDESLHYVDTVKRRYRALAATSLEAAHRYINDEISKAEKAGDEDRLQDLMDHLRQGSFDRRVSLRIPAPPGTMDVVWFDDAGGEHAGGIIDISLHTVLFDASGYRGEQVAAIRYHPSDRRFGVKSYRMVDRDSDQKVVVIENFAETISDMMHWIELLTRLDNDQ